MKPPESAELLMPAHYAYREPDKKTLCQGDILRRTDALVRHLRQYHPYYADHPDYKYFMVLTQTCDLVRRKGKPCTSQYITLAAARPVEIALLREAAKRQDNAWQREAKVISAKDKDILSNFLKSLLDNNKERYFYIHTDVKLGIQQNCCVFLQLSVSLKAEHYDMCLDAKICELQEMFQAKLGFQIGHMYNRVGTTEWDSNYPDYDVDTAAKELIEDTFFVFEERQIKEGIADLKRDKTYATKKPDEIRDYIDKKIVVPWREQFQKEAINVLSKKSKPIDLIRGQVEPAITNDPNLSAKIDNILAGAGVAANAAPAVRDAVILAFRETLRNHLSDARMPQKQDVFEKWLAWLMSETLITQSLRS